MFIIAGSPGYLDIYYKDVSFEIINGSGTLIKEYGSWHKLYSFYLFGYFGTMVGIIVHSFLKKTTDSLSQSIILALAVFINIGVWLIEQLVKVDFEILSVSYIISELFLWGLDYLINENKKLKSFMKDAENASQTSVEAQIEQLFTQTASLNLQNNEKFGAFLLGIEQLTKTERIIFNAYIERQTTKEIIEAMNITENTLKFHNKNIYGKLGVSSRKELLEIYKSIRQTI